MGIGEFDNVLETEPFKDTPHFLQKQLVPGAKEFKAEINRRTHHLEEEMDARAAFICTQGSTPRPGKWKKEKCLGWLDDPLHIIATAQNNVVFLRDTIAACHEVLVQQTMDKKTLAVDGDNLDHRTREGFQGLQCKLCLIHTTPSCTIP
jgi:hypothetical protein